MKAAGIAPPNIRKDKWWGTEDHRSVAQKGGAKGGQNNGKSVGGKSGNADASFKKSSISGMGLSRPRKNRIKTVFDREEELDDEEAPGGFRDPIQLQKIGIEFCLVKPLETPLCF